MYLTKTPKFLPGIFQDILWKTKNGRNEICLTFDDGPNPISTPYILEVLEKIGVKAVFFCLGKNIENHPDQFSAIVDQGHQIGNHGYDHLSGWSTPDLKYFINTHLGYEISGSRFFRPAYGRISLSQYYYLRKKYQIVLWDVMAGDFETGKIDYGKRLIKIRKSTDPGSLVVFHDDAKYIQHLTALLPQYIEIMQDDGYSFRML